MLDEETRDEIHRAAKGLSDLSEAIVPQGIGACSMGGDVYSHSMLETFSYMSEGIHKIGDALQQIADQKGND